MRLLLDTHAALWLLSADPRLGPDASDHFKDERNQLLLSAVVVWEVALKRSLGNRLLERQRQLNISLRKTFRTRGVNYSAEFDLYNALNADTVLSVVSSNYGTASYDVPMSALAGGREVWRYNPNTGQIEAMRG